MIWGYAGVWPNEFTRDRPQSLLAHVEFLVEWGLQCTGAGAAWLDRMEPAERDAVFTLIAEHDLHLTLGGWGAYFADAGEARRQTDAALEGIRKYKDLVRAPIVTTAAGGIHRFIREPPLEAQFDLLAERLAPLAAGCREMGLRLGIENHGDYYVSDLVELCRRVPDLYLFLDTGNTYLIGEKPLPAIREAAPYTIGTHFKDHRVCPRLEARPLHFEVGPSVLGEGDVGLAEAYRILVEHAPDPENLVMEIEMVPPDDPGPVESLKRSLGFVRSLGESARR
jgi:sugar phosphate isomerase/epimerase